MVETKINMEEASFYASLVTFKNPGDVISFLYEIQHAARNCEGLFREDKKEWEQVKEFVGRWFNIICRDI